jgi:hypothetical protein
LSSRITDARDIPLSRGISCLLMPRLCRFLRSVTSFGAHDSISDLCLFAGYLPVHTTRHGVNRRLGKSIRGNHACSVVMDNPELAFGEVEVCFFSYDEQSINHIGLIRRSIEVATAKYNMKFFRMVNIPSFSLEGLAEDPYFYHFPLEVLKTICCEHRPIQRRECLLNFGSTLLPM